MTPLFIISYNRPAFLEKVLDSYRNQSFEIDLQICDNGSNTASALEGLVRCASKGANVLYLKPIHEARELNKLNETIATYFSRKGRKSRYIVTDCDIDLSNASPSSLSLYNELLDIFPNISCVGPMLTIRDIPRAYPLYNHVMNRHIRQFWRHEPSWILTSLGPVAYISAHIDTTFALHREGTEFFRMKPGLRIYYPFEAQHLDWYLTSQALLSSDYARSSIFSHWNSHQALQRSGAEPLMERSFIYVDKSFTGELCAKRCYL